MVCINSLEGRAAKGGGGKRRKIHLWSLVRFTIFFSHPDTSPTHGYQCVQLSYLSEVTDHWSPLSVASFAFSVAGDNTDYWIQHPHLQRP